MKTFLIISACTLAGATLRYALCIAAELLLTAAVICSAVFSIVLIKLTGLLMPPAGALGILPMIIPQENLLVCPAEIFAGAAVFMPAALGFRKKHGVIRAPIYNLHLPPRSLPIIVSAAADSISPREILRAAFFPLKSSVPLLSIPVFLSPR